MMNRFTEKVSKTIEKFHMTDKSEQLLVCLSGGADSTALLLCLYEAGYKVEACHINHNLRGEESDSDQRFCEELCRKLGIKIHVFSIDVKTYCREHSVSTEEGAREMRYKAFASVHADKICTAHTLSDRLETTVFNLARGTGLKGLCSIPATRNNIIRPLIECSRQEVEEYLSEKQQDFVTDSSNLTDDYSRNKIRHNVVPVLEMLNSSLMKSYADTVSYLNDDNDFIEEQADNAYILCVNDNRIILKEFCLLHKSIKSRVIMRWLEKNELAFTHSRISDLMTLSECGGKICVRKNLYICSDNDFMFFTEITNTVYKSNKCVNIDKAGEYSYCGRAVSVKIVEIEENSTEYENVHKKFANCCMDYDKIKGELLLHKRFEGDEIVLVNRNFTSSVRKLVNKAFSAEKRDKIILLYDDDGVVFVEGYGVADRVKITEKTHRILVFSTTDII